MESGDRCAELNYDFKDFPTSAIVGAMFRAWTDDAAEGNSVTTMLPDPLLESVCVSCCYIDKASIAQRCRDQEGTYL